MSSLNDLTPQEEQKMNEVRDFWLNYLFGCNTTLNKEEARKGVEWLYEKSNLKKPNIYFGQSPEECQCIYNVLWRQHHKDSTFKGQYKNIKPKKVYGSLREQHLANHLSAICMEFDGPHDNEELFDKVLSDMLTNFKKESFSSYGNVSDYGWVSYYDFFNKIGKFDNPDFFKFRDMLLAGVYDQIQLEDHCIVCEMPSVIKRNEQQRLHSLTSPAVEFRDGYKLGFVNGRAIPLWIIEQPELITKEIYLKEQNSDHRGAMYEILGQQKMMELLGAKEVARATNTCKKPKGSNLQVDMQGNIISGGVEYEDATEEYILYESEESDPEIGKLKWVGVQCPSTGTNYLLGVPPETTNPLDAVGLTFGLSGSDYKLEQTS